MMDGCHWQDGTLSLVDVGAAAVSVNLPAHTGAVWGLAPLPDASGFVSCSADHTLKFWEWEVRSQGEGQSSSKRLGAKLARTHEATDDVLCIRVSADGRLIAAALLDSTIQVMVLTLPDPLETRFWFWLSVQHTMI